MLRVRCKRIRLGSSKFLITTTHQRRATNEFRYYFSSLTPVRGARIAQCVRQHWEIDIGLNWTPVYELPRGQVPHSPSPAQENFTWLRRTALSSLKQYQGRLKLQGGKYPPSIRRHSKSAGWDNQLLANLLLGTT